MGRIPLIEKHHLGPRIAELQERGFTSWAALSRELEKETGHRIASRTIRRWCEGETGSAVVAARRAKPQPTNGEAKTPPPPVAAVSLDGDPLDESIRIFLAIAQDPQATVAERLRANEQAAKFSFLRHFGELPDG